MATETGVAGQPAYANPPILEASITIHIEPLAPDRFALLGRVGEKLGSGYHSCRLLSEYNAEYLDTSSASAGMVFSTDDGRLNVQARSDAFAFSQQTPYEGWESFLAEVRSAWEAYRAVVTPLSIRRLSVMYVNAVPFPFNIPLSDLFNTYPAIPNQSVLFNFLSMNYRIPIEEIPGGELSVLMMNLPHGEDSGRMLLANTFFFRVDKEESIWKAMPIIRKAKNSTFESQLKPILKERFK
jgi:uncharacterized protein (TIGR04255 family)